MEVNEVIKEVSKKIEKLEENRKKLVKAFREISNLEFRIGNLTRDRIINRVEKVPVNGKICGIDGGLQTRSFHGIDIIVIRAVGVCIEYEKGKIESIKYYQPKAPKIYVVESKSDSELIILSSMYRMIEEVERAIEVTSRENPNCLMLDGPIYPHPSVQSAKFQFPELYEKVIQVYDKLIEKVEVLGIVEDSRSKYLSKVLKDSVIPNLPKNLRSLFPQKIHEFRDTSLLFGALKEGERTFTFKVSGIRDVKYKDNIFAFYLKTVKYDRPVRIEFVSMNPGKVADKISSLVFSLSSFSTYGIPSVLIEADARAHLPDSYLTYIERSLLSSSPLLMSLRRESRPI